MNASAPPKLTPMMRQYLDIKKDLPDDTLLLFRMGDFYEIFFDDAVKGAEVMEINQTKRAGVPMAGVPYHALQNYLPKILEAGVKVAIAEQVEDPKEAKGLVRREVSKIITPGTILEDNVLTANKSNFIVTIHQQKGAYGIATLDLSTGEFRVTQVDGQRNLEMEICRLNPAECLVSESFKKSLADNPVDFPKQTVLTQLEDWNYDADYCKETLTNHFKVTTLDGFGCRDFPLAVTAAGVTLFYVTNNMRRKADHITLLSTYQNHEHMILDRISQRNLELVEPIFKDSKNSTLISVLDKCISPMGSRLMREWILRPLINKDRIDERLDSVEAFYQDQLTLQELRECLSGVKDIERIITRMNVGSANARDLLVLKRALMALPDVSAILDCVSSPLLNSLRESLGYFPELTAKIDEAILEEPPLTIKDGGIIKDGFNEYLDKLRKGASEGKAWLLEYEQKEKERTGIKAIKVRYNKVFGYYIELSKANAPMAPENYTRKQTLTNAERFITPELKEIESAILGSDDKAKALEYEIFQKLREEVIERTAEIQQSARSLAQIDVLATLAHVALHNSYTRPQINTERVIDIQDGRHPVVDAILEGDSFVPNDTSLNSSDSHMHIITGPNMAGKSTYIRQVAMMNVLAQMGSFVPCSSANIGIMKCVFTRIGAADDLSRGQSTFMVEMIETANILNNADADSLVILDEIGRGTSTFDGLSLAWAIAEYLQKQKSLTLFATHYHELTELSLTLGGVKNYNVAVREQNDKIIFLHKILEGGTDKSYGIYVAKLAGLPLEVIERSKEVLDNLEGNQLETSGEPVISTRKKRKKKALSVEEQPTLFGWDE